MTAQEAERYMAQGQFPPGSMQPKIEAALGYLDRGGKEVLITSLEQMANALEGKTGTVICRTEQG